LRRGRNTGSARSHAGTLSNEIFHYLNVIDGSAEVNDAKDEDTQNEERER
jgi:hypothetical protein